MTVRKNELPYQPTRLRLLKWLARVGMAVAFMSAYVADGNDVVALHIIKLSSATNSTTAMSPMVRSMKLMPLGCSFLISSLPRLFSRGDILSGIGSSQIFFSFDVSSPFFPMRCSSEDISKASISLSFPCYALLSCQALFDGIVVVAPMGTRSATTSRHGQYVRTKPICVNVWRHTHEVCLLAFVSQE